MDVKVLLMVFGTVFLAELGDKTQLATLLFANRESIGPWTVFGVVAGNYVADQIDTRILGYVAGIGFIIIGAWTIWQAS